MGSQETLNGSKINKAIMTRNNFDLQCHINQDKMPPRSVYQQQMKNPGSIDRVTQVDNGMKQSSFEIGVPSSKLASITEAKSAYMDLPKVGILSERGHKVDQSSAHFTIGY